MRIAIGSDHRGYTHQSQACLLTCKHAGIRCWTSARTEIKASIIPIMQRSSARKLTAFRSRPRHSDLRQTAWAWQSRRNKFHGVRAANCYDEVMAEMCPSPQRRERSFACPGDLIGNRPIDDLVRIWLTTEIRSWSARTPHRQDQRNRNAIIRSVFRSLKSAASVSHRLLLA